MPLAATLLLLHYLLMLLRQPLRCAAIMLPRDAITPYDYLLTPCLPPLRHTPLRYA